MLLSIANKKVALSGGPEAEKVRTIDGFAPFVLPDDEACQPDCAVLFGQRWEEGNAGEELYAFPFEDADIRCRFVRDGEQFLFFMLPSGDDASTLQMRYCCGSGRVLCATRSGAPTQDATMLRYAIWFAFVLLGIEMGVTLVHSSAIVNHGHAVLFLGESGTGKSTHTRLWLNHIGGSRLLNDDCPALAIEDGQAIVYGTPWSGKTPCYHNRRFPLKALVRLSQAPENKIRHLGTIEAFAALQPSCPPALAYDNDLSGKVIRLISDTLTTTPVYHLACLPDREAAMLSHNTVFAQ